MPGPNHPLQLSMGLIVWSVWFVTLYGGLSVGCAYFPPEPELGARTWLNGLLALLTLVTVCWLFWQARVCRRAVRSRRPDGEAGASFVPALGACVYLAAALSALFISVPLMVLPPCV